MPPVRMRGDGRKAKNPKKTLSRLLSYMKPYKTQLIISMVCLLLAAIAQAASSKSIQYVIDDYIAPLLGQANPNFLPLIRFLMIMAGIYLIGIVSNFLSSFLMAKIGQATQKDIRDRLFSHMQTLPIRYFDTHTAGDLMSRYTGDIDTLRQLITQAIPQCVSSVATLVAVFIIIFLVLLIANFIGQVIAFGQSIYTELIFRF